MDTWAQTRERLGLPAEGPATELARRVTAPARHEARIAATIAAATDAACSAAAVGAAALILADLVGEGGPLGCGFLLGTGRTARAGWAAGLGSGRWQAADGEAYRAAARAALSALAVDGGYTLRLAAGGPVLYAGTDEGGSALVARGAVIRAAFVAVVENDARRRWESLTACAVRVEGSAAEWAALVTEEAA